MMVSSKKELRAKAGSARVFVAKGAAAFVVNNGRDVCILSLHEGKLGDVSVLVDGQEISLRAGEQAVITNSASSDWSVVSPLPNIPIRSQREHCVGHARVLVAEYSIAAALSSLQSVRNLAKSNSDTYTRILKNAAVLQTMSAKKGPYKALRKPLVASAL
jgi:hypothetical protein